MSTPWPEELSDLPPIPPEKYYLRNTQRAVRDLLASLRKKNYAESQITHYKDKIKEIEVQIQIWQRRKEENEKAVIEGKRKASRYLKDDIERYEDHLS